MYFVSLCFIMHLFKSHLICVPRIPGLVLSICKSMMVSQMVLAANWSSPPMSQLRDTSWSPLGTMSNAIGGQTNLKKRKFCHKQTQSDSRVFSTRETKLDIPVTRLATCAATADPAYEPCAGPPRQALVQCQPWWREHPFLLELDFRSDILHVLVICRVVVLDLLLAHQPEREGDVEHGRVLVLLLHRLVSGHVDVGEDFVVVISK